MRSCIKKWNHHHHPAPFSGLAFPAIILHNNSLFSCLNHSPKMASSKAITDFFPPAKRSKGVAASAAPSSFDPSFKRSFISVPPKPTTTGSAPFTPPESTDDDVSTAVQPSSSSNLTAEQKLRVQFKQSLAKAKRNLRICTERVSKSTSGLKLEQLLVEETWLKALPGEFEKPYAKKLSEFVESEIQSPIPIYPPQHLIFNALNSTPFDKVKAVVIGQDPYHGPGQAMGLSFSVPEGIKVPSSLINIYKELQQDLDCSIPSHGNLERWAVQGVLLLNAVLTGTTLQSGNHFNRVEMHQANSHAKKGWEQFTDSVIEAISKKRTGIVFLLWGNYAQAKSRLIDESKHHILKAAHPSGLSAHKGFFGCRHFSRTNLILEKADTTPIDWQL